MTLKEAIYQRHTVRKFTDKAIPSDVVELLNQRVKENNAKYGLDMELVTGNSDGLMGFAKALISKGVNNYFVLAAKEGFGKDIEEKLGYCGSDLCLYAQTLGLNTWWVGGMYSGKGVQKNITSENVKVNSIIIVGYGQTQGAQHKSKSAADISSYDGEEPAWFKEGIDALLHAPTAINKQAYKVKGHGNKVSITYSNGPFSGVDLGIGKNHFEIGAGKENFEWE